MIDLDLSLLARAERHLYDAFATFGAPGSDPVETAQAIAAASKSAGFSKNGRRRLLEYLFAFVEILDQRDLDPFAKGLRHDDPTELFGPDKLGGLFAFEIRQPVPEQPDLFDAPNELLPQERALIEQLIAATRLYETSDAVTELLAFTVRLRAFAPFNAMLLHIQKPGLTHAATAQDWWKRFGRVPKRGARPMLVLRAMGPVDFVFDILDTEGRDVPASAFAFPTFGDLSEVRFNQMLACVGRERIEIESYDGGEGSAGWISCIERSVSPNGRHRYRLAFNRNHTPATRFVTIAHELAHLFLGHLGADKGRGVSDRRDRDHALCEVEAETAAYLVAKRNGVTPRSESYLSAYKGSFAKLDLYAVMRAANAAETAMGIGAHHLWAQKAVGS